MDLPVSAEFGPSARSHGRQINCSAAQEIQKVKTNFRDKKILNKGGYFRKIVNLNLFNPKRLIPGPRRAADRKVFTNTERQLDGLIK